MEQILYGILDAREQLIAYGREEGRKGKEKYAEEQVALAFKKVAKNLLQNGFSPEVIASALPMSLPEIQECQKSLENGSLLEK